MSEETIKVVEILGNDYSIKAPPGEEQALYDAAMMLKSTLADTKRKYPTLVGDRLLVLTAMNLCSQLQAAREAHEADLSRYQAQVNATVDTLAKTIAKP